MLPTLAKAPSDPVMSTPWRASSFWTITPPATIEMAFDKVRVKPKVVVTVVISYGLIEDCSAMRGAAKLGPMPIPASIWKMINFERAESIERSINNPKARVMKKKPVKFHILSVDSIRQGIQSGQRRRYLTKDNGRYIKTSLSNEQSSGDRADRGWD